MPQQQASSTPRSDSSSGKNISKRLPAPTRLLTVMVPPSKGCFYFDLDGRPARVASTQLGITARGEAADALQRSEKRLQLALRVSIDALWDLDLRTTVPTADPAGCR